MTVVEVKTEAKELFKEHWWNGAGVVVVMFLIVTFVWVRPDNIYLLYAALVAVAVHSLLSALCFGQSASLRRHRREIAVAYREQIRLQEAHSRDAERFRRQPVVGRRRGPGLALAHSANHRTLAA